MANATKPYTGKILDDNVDKKINFQKLLGKYVNLNLLITRHINGKIISDLDACLHKFEGNDITISIEYATLIKVLGVTHSLLTKYLDLDDFNDVLQDVSLTYFVCRYDHK